MNRKNWNILTIFVVLVLAVAAVITSVNLSKIVGFNNHMEKVVATVTGETENGDKYDLAISYVYSDQKYDDSILTKTSVDVGSEIYVYVNSNDPTEYTTDGAKSMILNVIILLFILASAIVYTIIMIKWFKHDSERRSGRDTSRKQKQEEISDPERKKLNKDGSVQQLNKEEEKILPKDVRMTIRMFKEQATSENLVLLSCVLAKAVFVSPIKDTKKVDVTIDDIPRTTMKGKQYVTAFTEIAAFEKKYVASDFVKARLVDYKDVINNPELMGIVVDPGHMNFIMSKELMKFALSGKAEKMLEMQKNKR